MVTPKICIWAPLFETGLPCVCTTCWTNCFSQAVSVLFRLECSNFSFDIIRKIPIVHFSLLHFHRYQTYWSYLGLCVDLCISSYEHPSCTVFVWTCGQNIPQSSGAKSKEKTEQQKRCLDFSLYLLLVMFMNVIFLFFNHDVFHACILLSCFLFLPIFVVPWCTSLGFSFSEGHLPWLHSRWHPGIPLSNI